MTCPECGAEFVPDHKQQVCCSAECQKARTTRNMMVSAAKRAGKELLEKTCVECGRKFLTRYVQKVTCSRACSKALAMRKQNERVKEYKRHARACMTDAFRQMVRARNEARRERAVRLARRDALAPKESVSVFRDGRRIVERRGHVPIGFGSAVVVSH